MKKLTNFFNKNLTHKILPLLALFLLMFNLFFVSTVQALSSSFCGEFTFDIEYEIKLQAKKFFNYDHYVCCGFNANNSNIQYIYVCLFNESDNPDLKFYVGDYQGWYALYSNKSLVNGYRYELAYNVSTGLISVNNETVLNEQFCQISSNFATCNQSKHPILSNYDIYTDNSITDFFYKAFNEPRFGETKESISNLAGNSCLIFPGDLSSTNTIKFRLTRLYDTDHTKDEVVYSYDLNSSSKYYKSVTDSNGILQEYWYEIPYSDMYSFEKGQKFRFELEYYKNPNDTIKIPTSLYIEATIGSVTTTDKIQDDINSGFNSLNSSISSGFDNLELKFQSSTNTLVEEQQKTQNAINEQTNTLKETQETNKSIFDKLKELVEFFNPLSDKFFVKQLIKLLIEALKSLFIPSDDFFNNWLADLNKYFGDRFGILYYPFEVVIDFLTRFVNACDSMSSSSAVINVPEMKFMGVTLISAFSYDFNSLLVNDTLKIIHDIYLVVIDVIFSLMLVNLAKNTFTEIFGGRFSDEIIGDMTSISNKSNGGNEQ